MASGAYLQTLILQKVDKGVILRLSIAGKSKAEVLTMLEQMIREDGFEDQNCMDSNLPTPYDYAWRVFPRTPNNKNWSKQE